MFPFANFIEESNSIGFRHYNPLTLQDSININCFISQNSNAFPAIFAINDGSIGLHHFSVPRPIEPPIEPISQNTDEIDQEMSDLEDEDGRQEEKYNSEQRQKLSSLSARVMRVIRSKRVTTADAITKEIVANNIEGDKLTRKDITEMRKVKRRIYDTINVFAALGAIIKTQKSIEKVEDQNGKVLVDKIRQKHIAKLKTRSSEQKELLELKTKLLRSREKQHSALQNLILRNKSTSSARQQGGTVDFPFIAFVTDKDEEIEVVSENVEKTVIQSGGQFNLMGDMDIVELISMENAILEEPVEDE